MLRGNCSRRGDRAAKSLAKIIGMRPDDRALSYLPLAHIFERACVECVALLDGRAHLDRKIRQWNGDSRGHWQGNTLVVDTTNLSWSFFARASASASVFAGESMLTAAIIGLMPSSARTVSGSTRSVPARPTRR